MTPARTHTPTPAARRAAAAVALLAWGALATQLAASTALLGTIPAALWEMLRYFTILTNLALALTMTALALGQARRLIPATLGGVTLSILLVGTVYHLLLRGLVPLQGAALAADLLLHTATPLAALAYWIAHAPRGGLRPRHAWLFALYPFGYGAYALARGLIDGRYPYPFLDPSAIGPARAALNGALVLAAFVLAALLLIRLDRLRTPLFDRGPRP